MSLWYSRLVCRSRICRPLADGLVAIFIAAVLALEASAGFLPPVSYTTGSSPRSVAVGDFNGDGHLDLAVANFNDGTLSILLGNGDGTFQDAQGFNAGSFPYSVAVGDFNGDGIPDLAVANYLYPHSTVSILLGKGDGTFGAAQCYPVGVVLGGGDYATSVAVADFNGDGRLDLAVVSGERDALASPGFVSVLFGNGDGTFQEAQNYGVGFWPNSVAVGDFNGDGHPDIAVANGAFGPRGATLSVLLAHGDGTFQDPQSYQVGDQPQSVVVWDFNGDGHLGLAVGDNSGVEILLGNGDGTLQAAQTAYSISGSLAVGDFNSDGHLDLAIANFDDGAVHVLLGKGDGTFRSPFPPYYSSGGSGPISMAVGDFNGDGYPDLAVANGNSNTVAVLLNAADWGR
jgi:hypothetical protein